MTRVKASGCCAALAMAGVLVAGCDQQTTQKGCESVRRVGRDSLTKVGRSVAEKLLRHEVKSRRTPTRNRELVDTRHQFMRGRFHEPQN